MLRRYKAVLPDVTTVRVQAARKVQNPVYSVDNLQVSQRDFSMQVPGVGSYYVHDGREVEYSVEPGADPGWVKLYLNGQVLVALLHQRKIINFHASSFIYDGKGIMILGTSGSGKSSLTASFTLQGAGFLSDDITPVIFRDGAPLIWPLYSNIRLRENTVEQLKISRSKISTGEVWTGKHFLQVAGSDVKDFPLHTVLKIETGDCSIPEFHEDSPAQKFSLLRSEICSWEMLAGMPETEAEYLQQLLQIVRQVKFVRVVRPADIRIVSLHDAVRDYLGTAKG